MSIVARVTMNAGICTTPTKTPLRSPHAAPKSRAKSSVSGIESVMLNTTTEKPATRASIEPTERSISPVRQTMPMPMAMVPMTALWRRTFMPALSVRPPLATAYTMRMARNTSTKLYFFTRPSAPARPVVLVAFLSFTVDAPHSWVWAGVWAARSSATELVE